MPRVSVVIPSYNHEKYVRECIQSVLDQTYQDFEIVITDDGSTDGTVNVIKEFDDSRIQLYTHAENKGASTAANNCIQKAAGEYLAGLNSDDAWEPTKLEKQVKYLDSHPEIGAVFTKVAFVDEAGNLIGPEDYKNFYIFEKENRSRYEWLKFFFSTGNCLCHPSVLIRKKCYDEVGLYDERMANLPDMDMWTRLCFKYEVHILDEKLVRFRIMADKSSASADKPSTHIRLSFEYIHILNHYLAINDREILLKIFPEAEKYGVVKEEYIPYFLSRIALDINTRTWYLWGLQTLFNFLGQDGMAISLEKKYGFRYTDFYNLAAQHDIFNIESVKALGASLREKVSQIHRLESHAHRLESHAHRLESQIHRLESQIQQIQQSTPLQLANRYQRRVERLLPPGTRRRRCYELQLSGIRVILNEGWRSFLVRFKRWLLRNPRLIFKLLWWRGIGQFTRAGQAVLPYYQRYVPLRVKQMVPDRVRRAVQRRIMTEQPYNVKTDYPEWIVRNDSLSNEDRLLTCNRIASFKYKPKFSILMPMSNATVEYLRQAVDSVLTQLYRSWELCVVYDRSTSRKMRSIMEKYGQKDSRVRPQFRATGGGICACANAALEAAIGDWIVVMGPDDVLSEHALYLLAEAANSHPDAAIVYSDHDYIDAAGRRFNPYFKPDWDYDLFLGQNYINPLSAYRADLAHRVGGVREGFEGAQDWDFALRVLESVPNADVHHIPFVLYHQRATEDTFSRQSPAGEVDAAQRVVNEHFERTATAAVATPLGYSNHLRIRWELPKKRPMVSVIIPTKDQCKLLQACIDGLVNRTDYRPLEIVVVDNGSSEPDAVAFLDNIRLRENVKVVEDSLPFNFSRLVNLGVANSSGEICVLLNNDVDVINATWLDEMVSHALRSEVGAVGAKLYYANNTLQHAGVILGMPNPMGTVADRPDRCLPRKSHGYFNRLNLTRSLSCVAASCLATRRAIYESLGGFNEQDLAVSFNDIDFCLRVRQASYKVIWTPNAELYHYESISRGDPRSTPEKAARNKSERAYMRKQWGPLLDNDPYYNPNLSLTLPCFRPAPISRVRKPWSDVRGPDQDQMNRGGKGPKL